jgi:hypothetical protein
VVRVSEIAAGLTKAQRAFLVELPCHAVESYAPAKWLVFKHLATRSDTGRVALTDLGRQVAAHLLEHSK